jgi:co-chaperonin GroES (HSP10)
MTNLSSLATGQLLKVDINKSEWVTDSNVPDPDPLPKVTGYNLLIRPVKIDNEITMAGGNKLFLPASFTEDVKYLTNVGQVKALGPLCYKDPNTKPSDGPWHPHGRYEKPWCKVGDYVVWGRHQGVKMLVKGVSFILLQDELVLMVVDKPEDINPIMNAFNKG